MKHRSATVLFASLSLLWLASCVNRPVALSEPNTQSQIVERIKQGANKLDILFVVDDSFPMQQEQDELGNRVTDMVEELVHPSRDDRRPRGPRDLGIDPRCDSTPPWPAGSWGESSGVFRAQGRSTRLEPAATTRHIFWRAFLGTCDHCVNQEAS